MTNYDRTPGHPLAGVPEDVLLVVREALGAFDEVDGWDDNVVCEVGDAVAASLRSRGYLTWPTRLPSRESLVLAFMQVQHDWALGLTVGRDVSLLERLVDEVVLPLLGTVPTDVPSRNQVSGTVTGTVVQCGDVEGGLQL